MSTVVARAKGGTSAKRAARARAPKAAAHLRTSPAAPPRVVDEDAPPPTTRSPRSMHGQPVGRAELDELLITIRRLLQKARDDVEASYAEKASLMRTALAAIKTLCQLTGELGASEARVAASPQFKRLLTVILEALREHPAARAAVIEALERAQRGADAEAA